MIYSEQQRHEARQIVRNPDESPMRFYPVDWALRVLENSPDADDRLIAKNYHMPRPDMAQASERGFFDVTGCSEGLSRFQANHTKPESFGPVRNAQANAHQRRVCFADWVLAAILGATLGLIIATYAYAGIDRLTTDLIRAESERGAW